MKGVIMLKRSCVVILLIAIASATTFPTAVAAQSGGNFAVMKSVIAGGGGRSASGNFTVDSTIGESVAGTASTGGGVRSGGGGFWGVGEGDDANRHSDRDTDTSGSQRRNERNRR